MILVLGIGAPVAASYLYKVPVSVYNNSTANYTNFPVVITTNNTQTALYGFMESDGLDTNLQEGASDRTFSVAAQNIGVYIESLLSKQTRTYNYQLGYSPERTSSPIVLGPGGNITVPDSASSELGGNFTLSIDLNVSTTANGSVKPIIDKSGLDITAEESCSLFQSPDVSGNVTFRVVGSTANESQPSGSGGVLYSQGVGQTITVTGNSSYCIIRSLRFLYSTNGTFAPTMSVYSSLYGTYTGDVLASDSLIGLTGSGFATFSFDEPIIVASNTTLAFRLTWTGSVWNPYVVTPGTYPYGNLFNDTTPDYTKDLFFDLYYTPMVQVTATGVSSGAQEVVIKEQPAPYFSAGDLVTVPNNSSVNITGSEVSVECWINTDLACLGTGFADTYIWKSTGYAVTIRRNSAVGYRLAFYITATDGTDYDSAPNIYNLTNHGANQWIHFIGSYKGGVDADHGIYAYMNGEFVGVPTLTKTGNIVANVMDPKIGTDGGGRDYNGYLFGLRVYDYFIDEATAADHYNGIYNDDAHLVAYYPFSEGSDSNGIADLSGNSNNATITTGPLTWGEYILSLYMNSSLEDMLFGASVPDNAEDWLICAEETGEYWLRYINSIKSWINTEPTETSNGFWYEPVNMITSTNLPDRSGNGNTGTVNFGTNLDGIEVSWGALEPYSSYVTPGADDGSEVPTEWDQSGAETINHPIPGATGEGLPLYENFVRAAEALEWTVPNLYAVAMFFTAVAFGFGAMIAINSGIGFGIGFGIISAVAGAVRDTGGYAVYPVWLTIGCVIVSVLLVYVFRNT